MENTGRKSLTAVEETLAMFCGEEATPARPPMTNPDGTQAGFSSTCYGLTDRLNRLAEERSIIENLKAQVENRMVMSSGNKQSVLKGSVPGYWGARAREVRSESKTPLAEIMFKAASYVTVLVLVVFVTLVVFPTGTNLNDVVKIGF